MSRKNIKNPCELNSERTKTGLLVFLLLSCENYFCILDRGSLLDNMICKCILPLCRLFFQILDSVFQKTFHFSFDPQIIFFPFVACDLVPYKRNYCLIPGHKDLHICFFVSFGFPKSIIVLALTYSFSSYI